VAQELERKDTDLRRNKFLIERNWELVSGFLGVLGIDRAGGRCWFCNAKGLLQGATAVGALPPDVAH